MTPIGGTPFLSLKRRNEIVKGSNTEKVVKSNGIESRLHRAAVGRPTSKDIPSDLTGPFYWSLELRPRVFSQL